MYTTKQSVKIIEQNRLDNLDKLDKLPGDSQNECEDT